MTSRKKPGVAFWATVAIVIVPIFAMVLVLGLYVFAPGALPPWFYPFF